MLNQAAIQDCDAWRVSTADNTSGISPNRLYQGETIMKNRMLVLVFALLMVLPAAAWAGKLTKMDTPTLSCGAASQFSIDVLVCAGANTGAPAGFSLQWITADQLANGPDGIAGTADDNTWLSSDSLDLCKASFSGNANGSSYNLGKNACTTVQLGDNLFDDPGASSNCTSVPLTCGTTYAIRGFAHANSTLFRSNFTADLFCSTAACPEESCTFTQGYWKTHGPIPVGNNTNAWAVTSLVLGTNTYSDFDVLAILNTSGGAGGNGILALAHQLIAAKLNIAAGADGSSVAGAIVSADGMIGSQLIPPFGSGFVSASASSSTTATLDSFNKGLSGPGHCSSEALP
jgi:hypothetical protein